MGYNYKGYKVMYKEVYKVRALSATPFVIKGGYRFLDKQNVAYGFWTIGTKQNLVNYHLFSFN